MGVLVVALYIVCVALVIALISVGLKLEKLREEFDDLRRRLEG